MRRRPRGRRGLKPWSYLHVYTYALVAARAGGVD